MFRSEIWMITNLFAFGVIAGMGYVMVNSPATLSDQRGTAGDGITANVPLSASKVDTVSLADINLNQSSSRNVLELLKEGDRSLLAGNVHSATVRYNKALELSPQPSVSLVIRMAVCAERNNNVLLAERLYLEAEQSAARKTTRLAARLGVARVWQRLQKSDDALRSLSDLVLQSEDETGQPTELQAQILYQLASVVQEIALRDYHFDPSRQNGVIFRNESPDLTLLINLLDAEEADSQDVGLPDWLSGNSDNAIVLVQRPNDSVNNAIVSANKAFTPLTRLLPELAEVAKFELTISARANSAIAARSKALRFRNLPLSLVLDCVLTPLNLCWEQNGNQLQVMALDELEGTGAPGRIAIDVAQRLYRNFSLSFPGDYRSNAAMMASGNLYFLNGDVESAGNRYEALSASNPSGELRAALSFNYGKLNRQLDRREAAIDQLYLAVDQTYDPLIKSTGYWLIGQMYLELDDLENSIYASVRALATARDSKRKQLAALTLARAYLLNNSPLTANKVLFDNHQEFQNSPLAPLVTLLDNYAQYIGVEDERSKQVAEDRLVRALSNLAEQPLTSFFDFYIAGRAYQELGFPEKAIQCFQAAADSTELPVWKNRILFGLATEQSKTGQDQDAGELYRFLISQDAVPWTKLARIKLAELYLKNDLPEQCLSVCQQLIALELDSTERKKTLSMMGFAYRKLDQHYSSALCFAGIFPAEDVE